MIILQFGIWLLEIMKINYIRMGFEVSYSLHTLSSIRFYWESTCYYTIHWPGHLSDQSDQSFSNQYDLSLFQSFPVFCNFFHSVLKLPSNYLEIFLVFPLLSSTLNVHFWGLIAQTISVLFPDFSDKGPLLTILIEIFANCNHVVRHICLVLNKTNNDYSLWS